MEGMTLTGLVIAIALCLVVIVAQIVASAVGAVDPGAAF
jgi:hypothetical protein